MLAKILPKKKQTNITPDTVSKYLKSRDGAEILNTPARQALIKKIKRSFRVASNIYQGIGHKIIKKKCSFNEQRVYLRKFEKLNLTNKTFLKRSKSVDRPLHEKKLHASLQNLPDTDL